MTLAKAYELIRTQAMMGGGYNRNGALILAEVYREHGPKAVDNMIRELDLETLFGFKPGPLFKH